MQDTRATQDLYEGFDLTPFADELDVSDLSWPQLTSTKVKDVYVSIVDEQERFRFRDRCEERAKQLRKLDSFRKWLKMFEGERARIQTTTAMPDLPVRGLALGDYYIGEQGVGVYDERVRDTVYFTHTPIVITKLLRNVDDNTERVVLSFKKHGRWHEVTVPKQIICSAKDIVSLSQYGISVTSTRAAYMVDYLSFLEAANFDRLGEENSVSRMGWYRGEFLPYVPSVRFDGDEGYREIYEAVGEKGSFEAWYREVSEARKNPVVRILLDASLAAPLLSRLKKQIFFTHLWGGTETGKTVGLNLAMSVWGDCEKLVHTFNGTLVSMEKKAAFLRNIPFALDEFQTVKDKFYNADKMIYQLSSGRSKGRGNKAGGIDRGAEWSMTIITNGEQPLTDDASGGGSKNRAVEICCREKLFSDPGRLMDVIRANYGHAGHRLVDHIKGRSFEELEGLYRMFQRVVLCYGRLTDKQTSSVALLCVADALWNLLFAGLGEEAYDDTAGFLRDNVGLLSGAEEIKLFDRAYQSFISWVAQNTNKFSEYSQTEVYGRLDGRRICILPSAFKKFCEENDFSPKAVLTEFELNGVLGKDASVKRDSFRLNNRPVKGYKILNQAEEDPLWQTG